MKRDTFNKYDGRLSDISKALRSIISGPSEADRSEEEKKKFQKAQKLFQDMKEAERLLDGCYNGTIQVDTTAISNKIKCLDLGVFSLTNNSDAPLQQEEQEEQEEEEEEGEETVSTQLQQESLAQIQQARGIIIQVYAKICAMHKMARAVPEVQELKVIGERLTVAMQGLGRVL